MLFLVIERFSNDDPIPIGERFQREGRMLPDGVDYLHSWIDPVSATCYQIMEAENRESLGPWIDRWSDLVAFEVIPVQTSAEYWAKVLPH